MTLGKSGPVRVDVALGLDGPLPAGRHPMALDADWMAPGLYIARAQASGASMS